MKDYKSRYCGVCNKEIDHSKGENAYNILFKTDHAYIADIKIVCIQRPSEGGCDNGDRTFDSWRRYTPEVLASLYEDYFIPDHIINKFLYYKNKIDKQLAEAIALTKLNMVQLNEFWKHDKLNNILYYLNEKCPYRQCHILLNDNGSAEYWLNKFYHKPINNQGLQALADAFQKIDKKFDMTKFQENLSKRVDK